MRLAFDLDGTIADLHGALAKEARLLFPGLDPEVLPNSAAGAGDPANDAPENEPAQPSFGALNSRQQKELWAAVCDKENFWETLDEIEPGSLKRLYELVTTRKWELLFVTSRPESRGDKAQLQSHRWLSRHGYLTPSVFVVHGSRGKICAALDIHVLVDDRPENCLDVSIDSSARAILMWRGEAGKVPGSARQLGIGTVSSMRECLDILEELDKPNEQVGMVDRLKRLLGLGTSSARKRGTAAR